MNKLTFNFLKVWINDLKLFEIQNVSLYYYTLGFRTGPLLIGIR